MQWTHYTELSIKQIDLEKSMVVCGHSRTPITQLKRIKKGQRFFSNQSSTSQTFWMPISGYLVATYFPMNRDEAQWKIQLWMPHIHCNPRQWHGNLCIYAQHLASHNKFMSHTWSPKNLYNLPDICPDCICVCMHYNMSVTLFLQRIILPSDPISQS